MRQIFHLPGDMIRPRYVMPIIFFDIKLFTIVLIVDG